MSLIGYSQSLERVVVESGEGFSEDPTAGLSGVYNTPHSKLSGIIEPKSADAIIRLQSLKTWLDLCHVGLQAVIEADGSVVQCSGPVAYEWPRSSHK